jgi:splicing factor 3A subunit 3
MKIIDYRLWQVVTEFEEQWSNQKVQGWDSEVQENGHAPAQHTVIDLDYYSTVEELMEVGPEKLKEVIGPL